MSVFHRSTPLMPGASSSSSSSSRQTNEHPKGCLSPPLSLSSPLIKKKAIQIPSFDERGLIFEKCTKLPTADRSFDLISSKASGHLFWSKTYQRNHEEKASTLPKTKPKAHSSKTVSAKPDICISPASQPNTPPTCFTVKPKPSDSPLLPASQLSDFHQIQHQPKQRVSPTLIVPTPRLSPSPTSQRRENSPNSQQERHSSPVAKDRRARSIPISNSKVALNEVKHEILDQRTLLDFTHSRRQSRLQNESYKLPGASQNFNLRHNEFGTDTDENAAKDQSKCLNRNLNVDFVSKPKLQQECKLEEVTDNQKKSLIYTQTRSNTTQTSTHRSSEQIYSVKRTTLPVMPKLSSSTEFRLSPVSAKSETRERRLNSDNETKVDTTLLLGSDRKKPQEEHSRQRLLGNSSQFFQQSSQNIRSPQENRLMSTNQTTRVDVKSAVSRFDFVSEDHSCQSTHINQTAEAFRCTRGLNQVKKGLVAVQTPEAPHPIECTFTQSGILSNSDVQPHRNSLNQERPLWQQKSHKEINVTDAGLNPRSILESLAHNQVPTTKCLQPPGMAPCPFSSSKGTFDLLQQRVYQTPGETTGQARHQTHGLKSSVSLKPFITEDLEDPYYVTMYYPDSVYMDMSDVVPPEVRPKPAVPAKPPNVGAPSPSSPFPPQGLGIGGGGISAPPPSAIPVPIGSHPPSHVGSHGVGHVSGHAGGHPAAHSVGHGHGASHSSTGGSTLLGYIGIDTIIEQMRKKTMKTGFDFNIMVVGHSGLGKSTLVNTLFKSQVSRKSAGWTRDEKIPKTIEIKTVSHVIEEGGVKMKLTVVDTPGFGDQINNDNCWEPISKYINEQFEKFLKEEVNITRKKRIPDTRVHCCLYFIPPTGHCLRQLDTEFMRRLSHSVNIIPVIAKADTMTMEERQEFKQRVKKELETNGIEFYPQKEFDDDMEDKSDNDKIREAMPFAVVGSDKEHQVNSKRVLGRKTPWGIIEVENPNHCEFAQLRDFLIRSHLQDLKEVTHNIHYETYRAKRLNENGGLHPISSNDTQESNL